MSSFLVKYHLVFDPEGSYTGLTSSLIVPADTEAAARLTVISFLMRAPMFMTVAVTQDKETYPCIWLPHELEPECPREIEILDAQEITL